MSNALQVVQGIYGAFQRGDTPAIMAALADEVGWERWSDNSAQTAGVPWMKGGTGKSAALEFFGIVGQMKIHELQVVDMLANERQVAVEFVIDATAPNGNRYCDEEMHLWTVNASGQVVRMRHYADTAKHMRAAGLLR
jgi:ketosteroid isomerase-like protein